MRILYWGTFDTGKPRNRILPKALRECGAEVQSCHNPVWQGVADKSLISGRWTRLALLLKWVASYPGLLFHYLRLPRTDAVFIGYLWHLDVLVLWPFAKLRRVPIVLDLYVSLYSSIVEQRGLFVKRHPIARAIYALEWLGLRAADVVVTNTRSEADFIARLYSLPRERLLHCFIGVESSAFPSRPLCREAEQPQLAMTVLFYGSLMPLHGVETIVEAARSLRDRTIDWVVIGRGQEEAKLRRMLDADPLPRLTWIPWVPYEELVEWIHRADICLGIFGDRNRADWAVTNKEYQVLATGTPLITRDSAGIRELVAPGAPGIYLVPPKDSEAIVSALRAFAEERDILRQQRLHEDIVAKFDPGVGASNLIAALSQRLR